VCNIFTGSFSLVNFSVAFRKYVLINLINKPTREGLNRFNDELIAFLFLTPAYFIHNAANLDRFHRQPASPLQTRNHLLRKRRIYPPLNYLAN
jgi:hypothetical protein